MLTGKADTPIGTFIEYLQASDWVKTSIGLTKISKWKCPYFQRDLPKDIEKQIGEFFDETYTRECNELTQYFLSTPVS